MALAARPVGGGVAASAARAGARSGASLPRCSGTTLSAAHARGVPLRATGGEPANSSSGGSGSGGRRRALLALGAGALAAAPRPALAARPVTNTEVAAEESAYIQELLRKTEEKREERKTERLNDYYRRNFKDYFAFDAADEATARARGLSPETAAAVRKWMEDNAEKPMPGAAKRE